MKIHYCDAFAIPRAIGLSLSDGRASALVREYPVRFVFQEPIRLCVFFVNHAPVFHYGAIAPHNLPIPTKRHRIPRFPRISARGFNDADGFAPVRQFTNVQGTKARIGERPPERFLASRKFNRIGRFPTSAPDDHHVCGFFSLRARARDYFLAPRVFSPLFGDRCGAVRRGVPPPRVATGRH